MFFPNENVLFPIVNMLIFCRKDGPSQLRPEFFYKIALQFVPGPVKSSKTLTKPKNSDIEKNISDNICFKDVTQ